jgi:hypothetical protein
MTTFTAFNNNIAYITSPLSRIFKKAILPPQCLQLLFFLHKGTKQVDTNYNVPIMSKITVSFTEVVLTYFIFSIHRSAMYLFVCCSAVLLYTKLLSPLWSDRSYLLSETPVLLLIRTYLFPLNFGFDVNFFVIVIFKYKEHIPHTHTTRKHDTRNRYDYRYKWKGVKHYRPTFISTLKNEISPNTKTSGISGFFSAGVQKVRVAFKGHNLK